MSEPIVILDIDNCISEDAWRIPRIDLDHPNVFKRYHDYHMLSAWDRCRNQMLFQNVNFCYVIFTARPAWYRPMTEHWLKSNGVPYDLMWMRPNEDHSNSVELKRAFLRQMRMMENAHVESAFDDRPEIVAMYKEEGVPNTRIVCVQPDPVYKEEERA